MQLSRQIIIGLWSNISQQTFWIRFEKCSMNSTSRRKWSSLLKVTFSRKLHQVNLPYVIEISIRPDSLMKSTKWVIELSKALNLVRSSKFLMALPLTHQMKSQALEAWKTSLQKIYSFSLIIESINIANSNNIIKTLHFPIARLNRGLIIVCSKWNKFEHQTNNKPLEAPTDSATSQLHYHGSINDSQYYQ